VVRKADNPCGGKVKTAPGWGDVREALGGNRFTVRDGEVRVPSQDVYPNGWERNPRTGMGLTADGRLLMVTVDGRRKESRGVTLDEMGDLMVSLGAEIAVNLDGGGSTVMARFVRHSQRFVVANRPSDGKQRPATQALAAFQVKRAEEAPAS
jgi:exopolysaccharide biosynthesis protein